MHSSILLSVFSIIGACTARYHGGYENSHQSSMARHPCSPTYSYCGWALQDQGYQNVDKNGLYFCDESENPIMMRECQSGCDGPTAHCKQRQRNQFDY